MTQRFAGKKVLLLGSGGLRIGQAGEFDYSGSQAIKALKEEGIKVILVNPNIATVQTDHDMADEVYLQPLDAPTVTQIIAQERPDGVLLGFGGQTALNLGLVLAEQGVFARYGVTVLGTSIESIRRAEDRALFNAALQTIDIHTARSIAVTTVADALVAAAEIGYPIMLRAGFSLGGLGSGIIPDATQLAQQAQEALNGAPQILLEECLLGWHEFEYEIVRDCAGNTVTVCNMENLDPMGVHTGESIVVSPSQTLTNHEYHSLRQIAITVANHFSIIGECNIQYAVHPQTRDYRVIEINPRLSRSSALASKATGYPLAFIATKLALGWHAHELINSVTKETCAYFEPALDYIVVKIPRWDTHKLKAAERGIGTEMKSVGEVMAIGRSFPEALQKAIGMLAIGANDLSDYPYPIASALQEITHPTDRRLFALYQFFMHNGSVEDAHAASGINTWFLHHIHHIAHYAQHIAATPLSTDVLRNAKQMGFSDIGIGKLTGLPAAHIRTQRQQAGIVPYVKQIDTLAGEFAAQTNYLYMTYHAATHDLDSSANTAIIVLGSGPYCIGSSVEFDWCAVNTSRTLRRLNYPVILINSNPETVSTDYDESDRLYFEQLSLERVQDIADFERPTGIVVSVGGQIANKLALPLASAGYPILGTSADAIDNAENRQRFSSLLNDLHIDQPAWVNADSLGSAEHFITQVGYPVLIRPSYVLSGAAMNVVYDRHELDAYLQDATLVSADSPVVISKFIEGAKELEIDGVADHGNIVVEIISEHVENAGVHSGDATIVLPPQRLYLETIRRTKKITKQIVKALAITGPFNIQFIAKHNALQVIECNLRASRSFPFVSKVTDCNLIEVATHVMMGHPVKREFKTLELDYVAVKTPQFSYRRLKGSNPVAHVEMASTGEVVCLGDDLWDAFFRSWQATEQNVQRKRLFVSIGGDEKVKFLARLRQLDGQHWDLYTTEGTHDFLSKHGIPSRCVYKASDLIEPNVTSIIAQHQVDVIINIPTNTTHTSRAHITDGYALRRLAIDHHIPLITNTQLALLFLQCLYELRTRPLAIRSLRQFLQGEAYATGLRFPVGQTAWLNEDKT